MKLSKQDLSLLVMAIFMLILFLLSSICTKSSNDSLLGFEEIKAPCVHQLLMLA